jgi:transposase
MPLRLIDISETDAYTARYDMFYQPNILARKRALCLYMKYCGFKHEDIARLIGCRRGAVANHLTLYESKGYKGLIANCYYQPTSSLDPYTSTIKASFEQEAPRSVKEAMHRIETLTGVKRSLSSVRAFMHKIGFNPLRTGQIPAKADLEAQQKFHDEILQPVINQALEEKCHVLFLDSAHFVLQAFVAVVWSLKRLFVKGASGRFRLNVIGAIHATSKEFIGLYNTTYINAEVVVHLLQRIALRFADKPIFIVLDNARYQHCKWVKKTAEELNIQLLFLPPYSPNLNLIERLWKFIKAEVCAAKYYPDGNSFQQAIVGFIKNLNSETMKNELHSRLSLKFQLFDHARNLAA